MYVVLADKGAGLPRALFLYITEMKRSPKIISCLPQLYQLLRRLRQEDHEFKLSLA